VSHDADVDALIVGAGPVGLYAAYYAGFRGQSVAVMDSLPEIGGQVCAMYPEKLIYDIAGFPAVRGRDLIAGLAEQAERERAAEAERARQEVREERVRIARELHDVVAHTLAVITVQAGVGRRLMAKRPEEAGSALESIEMIGRTAQDELRVVLGLLEDPRRMS